MVSRHEDNECEGYDSADQRSADEPPTATAH